jgi:hypothetical protein
MNMKLTRVSGLVLAAAIALSACSGSTQVQSTGAQAPTSSADTYAGPAPATADVHAFQINFWANVRTQDRCGQCHNATSPAQMPNFARSDDVNLAYAQANTVVNLEAPATSLIVTKVGGGHNCWLSDPGACASILTTWISNWAGNSVGGTGTQVQLTEPTLTPVGNSKNFPPTSTDFATFVYPILKANCAKCHAPDAATPQAPYFASSDVDQAYQYAIPRMNLNAPETSRFVTRLAVDMHNCWGTCVQLDSSNNIIGGNAFDMLQAIRAFATAEPTTSISPNLVVSKAMTLSQGTVASGQGRYDTNVIAKYEFQTGAGATAFDTGGVGTSADLTLTGDYAWAGGWGITFGPKGGKGQASSTSSRKIHDLIEATGEFSVEAWVAPALVAADKSYMISYSGGDTLRNFTLGQTNQNYDFLMRTDTGSDLNGMPQLATPTAATLLQASLQHVVLTYDPVNGRKIYVNGQDSKVTDPAQGATIANWDSTFALVLGNEVAGDRPWQGLMKFAAIHSRALTAAQVMQNFNAGVGQRFYVLFNVADATGVSKAYVLFTVSQYDSSSYLFASPTFISLDPTVTPDGIALAGMRIGINGTIPTVGQAYIPLNTTISATGYAPSKGELLSGVGTVIAIQSGPAADQFFLSFDKLGSHTNVTTEPVPLALAPQNIPLTANVGVRTFAQINSSLSALTGVPTSNSLALQTYTALQQQLPSDPTLEGFSSANQVGVAQLAIQYCNLAVNDPHLSAALLPGVTLNGSTFSSQASTYAVTSALALRVLGTGIKAQPALATMAAADGSGELDKLVATLCTGSSPCNGNATRVLSVTAATCAAAMGSSPMLVN